MVLSKLRATMQGASASGVQPAANGQQSARAAKAPPSNGKSVAPPQKRARLNGSVGDKSTFGLGPGTLAALNLPMVPSLGPHVQVQIDMAGKFVDTFLKILALFL